MLGSFDFDYNLGKVSAHIQRIYEMVVLITNFALLDKQVEKLTLIFVERVKITINKKQEFLKINTTGMYTHRNDFYCIQYTALL